MAPPHPPPPPHLSPAPQRDAQPQHLRFISHRPTLSFPRLACIIISSPDHPRQILMQILPLLRFSAFPFQWHRSAFDFFFIFLSVAGGPPDRSHVQPNQHSNGTFLPPLPNSPRREETEGTSHPLGGVIMRLRYFRAAYQPHLPRRRGPDIKHKGGSPPGPPFRRPRCPLYLAPCWRCAAAVVRPSRSEGKSGLQT